MRSRRSFAVLLSKIGTHPTLGALTVALRVIGGMVPRQALRGLAIEIGAPVIPGP
jgi:hypothetical protein